MVPIIKSLHRKLWRDFENTPSDRCRLCSVAKTSIQRPFTKTLGRDCLNAMCKMERFCISHKRSCRFMSCMVLLPLEENGRQKNKHALVNTSQAFYSPDMVDLSGIDAITSKGRSTLDSNTAWEQIIFYRSTADDLNWVAPLQRGFQHSKEPQIPTHTHAHLKGTPYQRGCHVMTLHRCWCDTVPTWHSIAPTSMQCHGSQHLKLIRRLNVAKYQ